jgi:SM-20-related protein
MRVLFEQASHDIGKTARVRREPFLHCEFPVGGILSQDDAAMLLRQFPHDLLGSPRLRRKGTDKDYLVSHLDVFDRGRWVTPPADLPASWRCLLDYLVGREYRAMMADILEIGDIDMAIEVRISSYPRGGWMSRHTDRPDKVFSHNIYLCPGWNPARGGQLALYGDRHESEPARTVLPGMGNSVAFRRSDDSWHEVMPVAEDADRPRRAVLVHAYHSSGTLSTLS